MVRAKVMTVVGWYAQDEVNQEDSKQNEVDGMKKGAVVNCCKLLLIGILLLRWDKQESPAIADKPARRKSLPKIATIRRAHNVVADNTGLSSFV